VYNESSSITYTLSFILSVNIYQYSRTTTSIYMCFGYRVQTSKHTAVSMCMLAQQHHAVQQHNPLYAALCYCGNQHCYCQTITSRQSASCCSTECASRCSYLLTAYLCGLWSSLASSSLPERVTIVLLSPTLAT
jgi:hypothetical protein